MRCVSPFPILAFFAQEVPEQKATVYSVAEVRSLVASIPEVRRLSKDSPKDCFHIDAVTDEPKYTCFSIQKYCAQPNRGRRPGPTGVLAAYCVDRLTLGVFENYGMDRPVVSDQLEKAKERLRKKHARTQ